MNRIEQMIASRRKSLPQMKLPANAERIWGLALSGGGIRSATFCFGLLRALAGQQLLLRFDLVSTVSGGGYVGAMLGRLFSRATNARDVQAIVAAVADASSRWFVWWLRANGRYLIPRGAKDRTYAIGLYVRNLFAIHFELGMLAIVLGVVLATVDIAGWSALAHFGYSQPQLVFAAARYLPDWLPVVAFLLPLVTIVGVVIAIAYWCVPWLVRSGSVEPLSVWPQWFVALAFAAALWVFKPWLDRVGTDVGATLRLLLWLWTFVLIAAWLIAVPVAAIVLSKSDAALSTSLRADASRTLLTQWLANCLRAATVLLGVALVDRVAWYLAFEVQALAQTGVILALTAALVRALMPMMTSLLPGRSSTTALLFVGRVVGYAMTFILCAWWVSLVYGAALGAGFHHAGPDFRMSLIVVAALGLPVFGYLLLTGRNFAFLNLSSLHAFYRARLVRSYLGAANGKRFHLAQPLDAIDKLPALMPAEPTAIAIGEPQADDDIALEDYRPQRHGGPIHLLNVCINQTRDPRGGLFNQDRRGLAMSVASGGAMQVSQEGWKPLTGTAAMTLGTWTAISGAAVSPGLGSLTRGGISALATFAGLRLGYWWDSVTRTNAAGPRSPLTAKSKGLLRETFGVFGGTEKPDWFLSDGGHFENTGAYALLAERAQVIVLADCGADPRYQFCDIENLVRKARIDLQAEILFQRPKTRPVPMPHTPSAADTRYRLAPPAAPAGIAWPDELAAFGSLNDLASPSSTACLALAKITYSGARAGAGILILVKPNISSGLPVDLINFKAQNPDFPQQTTADQFFSEAQWESYFELGYFLGGKLPEAFVEGLANDPATYFEADEQSPIEAQKQANDDASAKPSILSRLPARIGTTAVTTGLGLGAAATVGVSAWQAIDSVKTSYAKQTSDEHAALKELTDLWAKIAPPSPSASTPSQSDVLAVGALAAAIVRTADTLCPSHDAGWFQSSPVAGSVYSTVLKECARISTDGRPVPCTVLLEAAHPSLQRPLPNCLVRSEGVSDAVPPPRYWVYDYSEHAPFAHAHPCDPVAAVRRKAEDDYEAGTLRLDASAGDTVGTAMPALPRECTVPVTTVDASANPTAVIPKATLDSIVEPPLPIAVPVPVPSTTASTATVEPDTNPETTAPASAVAATASSASSGASAASGTTSTSTFVPTAVCRGTTLYTQIYGPEQRREIQSDLLVWQQRLNATVAASEDVLATARNAGRAPPLAVSRTTVRFHDMRSIACARALGPALGQTGWRVEPLSPRLTATPGVVEVWLAPAPRKP